MPTGIPQLTATARQTELRRWSARLRAAAALAWQVWPDRSADPEALVRTFRDEAGHRRAVDEPFLRAIHGLSPAGAPAPEDPDVALWRAAAAPAPAWQTALQALSPPPAGPLTPPGDEPIEVWTERELCLLHALWRIGRLSGDDSLRERCLTAATWHLEHTQADNATNRPWAIHVFIALGTPRAGPEGRTPASEGAMFHGEQLLHNAMVNLGRPDRLSAHILEDAAGELDAEASR